MSVDFIRNTLKLINTFSKVVENKINIQKLAVFLHINDEDAKKGIREMPPFTSLSKEIKTLCTEERN